MVWRDVKLPEGKILIPGMISHRPTWSSTRSSIAWRIKNFASVVGKENVIAGVDCGFSQYWDSIRVHPTRAVGQARGAGRGRRAREQRLVGYASASRRRGLGARRGP